MKTYIRLFVTILTVVVLTGCFGSSRKDPAKLALKVVDCYSTGNFEKIATYLTENDRQQIATMTSVNDFLGGLFGGKKDAAPKPKEGEDKTVNAVVALNWKYKKMKEAGYGVLGDLKLLPGEYSQDKSIYKAKTRAVFARKTVEGDIRLSKGQDGKWFYDIFESNPLGR